MGSTKKNRKLEIRMFSNGRARLVNDNVNALHGIARDIIDEIKRLSELGVAEKRLYSDTRKYSGIISNVDLHIQKRGEALVKQIKSSVAKRADSAYHLLVRALRPLLAYRPFDEGSTGTKSLAFIASLTKSGYAAVYDLAKMANVSNPEVVAAAAARVFTNLAVTIKTATIFSQIDSAGGVDSYVQQLKQTGNTEALGEKGEENIDAEVLNIVEEQSPGESALDTRAIADAIRKYRIAYRMMGLIRVIPNLNRYIRQIAMATVASQFPEEASVSCGIYAQGMQAYNQMITELTENLIDGMASSFSKKSNNFSDSRKNQSYKKARLFSDDETEQFEETEDMAFSDNELDEIDSLDELNEAEAFSEELDELEDTNYFSEELDDIEELDQLEEQLDKRSKRSTKKYSETYTEPDELSESANTGIELVQDTDDDEYEPEDEEYDDDRYESDEYDEEYEYDEEEEPELIGIDEYEEYEDFDEEDTESEEVIAETVSQLEVSPQSKKLAREFFSKYTSFSSRESLRRRLKSFLISKLLDSRFFSDSDEEQKEKEAAISDIVDKLDKVEEKVDSLKEAVEKVVEAASTVTEESSEEDDNFQLFLEKDTEESEDESHEENQENEDEEEEEKTEEDAEETDKDEENEEENKEEEKKQSKSNSKRKYSRFLDDFDELDELEEEDEYDDMDHFFSRKTRKRPKKRNKLMFESPRSRERIDIVSLIKSMQKKRKTQR